MDTAQTGLSAALVSGLIAIVGILVRVLTKQTKYHKGRRSTSAGTGTATSAAVSSSNTLDMMCDTSERDRRVVSPPITRIMMVDPRTGGMSPEALNELMHPVGLVTPAPTPIVPSVPVQDRLLLSDSLYIDIKDDASVQPSM